MSIYQKMKEDWVTYCLMAGIAVVEEFSKPIPHYKEVMTKKGLKRYLSYHSIRLKMKDRDTVERWLEITRHWEQKFNLSFINPSHKKPLRDGSQYVLYFNSAWVYEIIKQIKHFPSKHTDYHYWNKIKYWKKSNGLFIISRKEINKLKSEKSLHPILFKDKFLAAGAWIISFDLECRGCESGRIDLTMSDKYKDFLEFMLEVANYYDWATKNELTSVKMNYSLKIGINASPQYCFRLKSSSLEEIYCLAGPLLDKHKDKCLNFQISRISNYINVGGSKKGFMKNKIYDLVKDLNETTTTQLQFHVNIGQDVINVHLKNLMKEGRLERKRQGKRYLWRTKDAYKCKT